MVSKAPINEPVDIGSTSWSRWFTDVSDTLSPPNWDFSPMPTTFTGMTGLFTSSLTIVRHGKILFFDLLIKPDGAIISTLGTTYFELPALKVNGGSNIAIKAQGYGSLNVFDVQTPLNIGQGYIDLNTLKAYLPTFDTAQMLSVTGWVRIEGL